MPTFRVFTHPEGSVDVEADTPEQARKIVQKSGPKVVVTKVKLVKGA